MNLLENARKYTPAGGEIRVLVIREGGDAVLSIRDSGVGIDPALLPRRVRPLRPGRSLPRPQQGRAGDRAHAGAAPRIEQHGGAVAVASEGAGKGSTFTVRLRAVSRPADSQAPGARAARPRWPAASLVIEDNDDSRQMLGQLIRLLGHEVYEAVDGVSGVSSALELAPDLALVDAGPARHRRLRGGPPAARAPRRPAPPPGGAHRLRIAGGSGARPHRRLRLHLVKPVDPARIAELLADGL